ncbi:MAG: insulinase family protein [Gammaproteobacteria bacterium]|nr:insulinase family protein [Gammaproteobacteria bacterium]
MEPRTRYRYRALVAVVIGAFLLGATANADNAIVKSPNDWREYASFELPNKLKVLVVSDPTTDKAAAALDVFVGTSSDPEDRQGLAHFLEHMLFLGTKKYPKPGEYQEYISTHGGRHNAYTGFEHTNYFFDIDKDYLEPTLDRFAQFFVAPLFTPEYVEREKNAVDAEYQLHKKDDSRRAHSARTHAVNPRHPSARFGIGRLDTLSDRNGQTVRKDLIEFYEQHYSANIMALLVLGKEPTDVLKQWVIDKFSSIKNSNAQRRVITEPLFAAGQLPAQLNITPLKERRVITLTFPIPPLYEHYRSKPTQYVANLLGHEGTGSLLSLLKNKGWVDGLSAGAGMDTRDGATFEVSMQLTEKGVAHVPEMASYVFQFLRLISERGIARWIFDEQRKIAEIDFRFQEKSSPLSFVSYLARNLQRYPAKDVLRGPYAMDEYDPALIRQFLAYLRPENVLLTVNAAGFETNAKDPWFGTSYRVTHLDNEAIRHWDRDTVDTALAFPEPNPFLPDNLAVKASGDAASKPIRIKQSPGFDLWFQQDVTFRIPKANFYFSVQSPLANDGPRHAMLTALYVQIVNDQLNEFSYPAYLAGLNYSLYSHIRGFSVRISGYDDKQGLLLSRIMDTLIHPSINPKRFAILKQELEQSLRNAARDRPNTQTMSEVTTLLIKPSWTKEQRLAALKPLTAKDLERFMPKLLHQLRVIALVHGNVDRREALALANVLEQRLLKNAEPVTVPSGQVVKLPAGKEYVRQLEIDHPDSAITVYLQGSDKSYGTRARVALTAQILSSPFYNDLRTEKQLGYVVFATAMPLLEVPGLAFVVQSPTTDPITLENYVKQFISDYAGTLVGMSVETFDRHKQALLARILEKDKRLQTRTNRYWTELDREHYQFDSREQLAAAVRRIDKRAFERFYSSFFLDKESKALIVRAIGSRHKEAVVKHEPRQDYTVIPDAPSFKRGKEYFPG